MFFHLLLLGCHLPYNIKKMIRFLRVVRSRNIIANFFWGYHRIWIAARN